MKKVKMRTLEETSYLAQGIKDKMKLEFESNKISIRYTCLETLLLVVREADDKNNENIYYDNYDNKRLIIIRQIQSMMKYGSDFSHEGVANKLRGLAERYKDDEGNYIVSVLTTNDLNSAKIKDVSELMFAMSQGR